MDRVWKRTLICGAIVAGSYAATIWMERIQFFHLLDLKAQDAHFVLRGPRPTHNIVIVGMDDKADSHFPELRAFWQPYFADAMRATALGGAKVMVLDHSFGVDVTKYEPQNDQILAQAFAETVPTMPVVCAFVNGSELANTVPINIMSSALGLAASAHLTVDDDEFVRRQELIDQPKDGIPLEERIRGLALRTAEKYLGQDAVFRGGRIFLGGREIPTDADRTLTINYAGPSDTFPHYSLYDVVTAFRAGNKAQLEKWFRGKAVLLGPDNILEDRADTPVLHRLHAHQTLANGRCGSACQHAQHSSDRRIPQTGSGVGP